MVRPSRRGRSRPLTSTEESTGVVDGDAIDWPTSPSVDIEAVDKWKQPVRFATTADLTIATGLNAGDTVDGVTLADGDRGLVKDEGAPELNGIYVVGSDPDRAPDFDEAADVLGSLVYVIEGTTNGGKVFYVDLTDEPVMGIDPITFAELGGGTTISDILDLPTAEMDDTLVLAPDGAGGVEFRAETGGGGGGTDWDVSPNPTGDDHEFKSSLSGHTTLGSLTTADANATGFDSLLRLAMASTGGGAMGVNGVYWAMPSGGPPFTVTIRMPEYSNNANYQHYGILLTEASPGKLCTWGMTYQNANGMPELQVVNWTNRTTRASFTEYASTRTPEPHYLRMVVNSNTSVDLLYSHKGYIFNTSATAWNPNMTIANVGIGITDQSGNVAVSCVVDWIRYGTGIVVQPEAKLWQNT